MLQINDTFQYVPIIESLKMFLRDKENRLMLSSSRHKPKTVDDSQPKVYNSYTCGECYEKIPYFRENPEALRLIIYNDDAEPCNTLSSRAGNSKIAAMYFKIQNIPLHFNSSKKAVFPLIYAKTMDAKRHGYNKVLGPLVDDLMRLEKGVPVFYGSEVYILKAAVIALAGDTRCIWIIRTFFKSILSRMHHFPTAVQSQSARKQLPSER